MNRAADGGRRVTAPKGSLVVSAAVLFCLTAFSSEQNRQLRFRDFALCGPGQKSFHPKGRAMVTAPCPASC
jgi:hypothetical protein